MDKLEWSALEYEEKERGNDWFWALGVIVVAGAIASILFKNYFFAILLIISGILLGYFAIKRPEMINYELNQKGFKIKNRLLPYDTIKSFWVQIGMRPTLFLKSDRLFMPILSIPIDDEMGEKIKRVMLLKKVPEEEMKEHPSVDIMEKLGF
jgi:hypothetical protein